MAKKTAMNAATLLRNGSIRVPAVLSYPDLFEPKASKDNPTLKYSCAAIVSKKVDISALEDAIEAAKERKWKGDPPKRLREPIRDGEEYDDKEGYGEGVVFFNARNTRKPYVRDIEGEPIPAGSEEVYPGIKGFIVVEPYGYDTEGNRGVGMSLLGFIKVGDGERLGGRAPNDPEEDMKDLDTDLDPDDFPF